MRRILLSLPLLLLTLSPAANAQTVSVPNTLTNGSVAEADAMNANFTELEVGVNAALTTGSVAVPHTFTNGATADADQVNANFTELETGVNTALANRATDCAAVGGTWDAGTSSCTAGYNCFAGGFCSQAAIGFPPADFGYANVYEGHTMSTEPALSVGCNIEYSIFDTLPWEDGVSAYAGCVASGPCVAGPPPLGGNTCSDACLILSKFTMCQ